MYSKKGPSAVPSDAQAREKLALYVYEYLCHVGAKEAAQTFLNEMHWHKQISVGEPPGFLHSWWCVFWDLYCAAPERRESCDHSSEAKAFHDYGFVNSGYAVNGMGQGANPSPLGIPPGGPDGLAPGSSGPHHPGFFGGPGVPNSHMRPSPSQQPVSQPSPSMMGQQPPGPFLNPRFPGGNPRGPGGMRIPPDHSQSPFNPAAGGPPLYQDQMGNLRQPGPPGMMPQRMPAGSHRMSHMNHNNFPGLRPPPNANMSPGMAPMNRPWPPSTSGMHFSDNSPGGQFHPPVLSNGPLQGPGTPIQPSPQMPDSSSAENMYLRTAPNSGNLSQFDSGSNMGVNDMLMNGDGLDIKNSPGGGPGVNGGTPGPNSVPPSQQSEANIADYPGFNTEGDTESAAILEIKNKMAEEAKRFEKSDTPGGVGSEHSSSEFFSMQ